MIIKVKDGDVWRMWGNITGCILYHSYANEKTFKEIEALSDYSKDVQILTKDPESLGLPERPPRKWCWICFKHQDVAIIVYFDTVAYIMNDKGETVERILANRRS